MAELTGKTVVVTGSASGVGAATVERCLAAGAEVYGVDLNHQEDGDNLITAAVDVSSMDSWQSFAKTFPDHSVDHLHLNAGIQSAPPSAPMDQYLFANVSLEAYHKLTGVNINGVVFGLKAMLQKMKPGGSIVVTGSLAGVTPYDVDPLYAMTKHAVTGLVRSLKSELRQMQLRINAICPGGIDTALIPHEQRTQAEQSQAVFMTGDDIAVEVLRLFATDDSGETWAKVAASKPAWIIHAPGRKTQST